MKQAKTIFLKYLLSGFLAVATCTGTAHAWWNGEWAFRKKITVDTTDKGVAVTDPIGTTAVLIRLHDGEYRFPDAKDDGSDIRFVAADDKTPLTYHLEKFDSLMSEAFVWVKIPDLEPGAQTTIWLYYGNNGPKAERVEDARGTYDANTLLVYHFSEKGAPANDSSPGGNHAQTAGLASDGSMIGGGLRLDGRKAIAVSGSTSLALASGAEMTWSAWIKPALLLPGAPIFSRKEDANGFVIGADNGVPYVEVTNEGSLQRSSAGAPIAVNSWHHLAVVAGGSKITLYLDGEVYSTLNAALPKLAGDIQIGGEGENGAAGFSGELDELEISKIARPSGFIKFAAISQGGEKASKLLTLGQDEQQTSLLSWFKGGYFGIIVSSLTFDGWAVILILMCMMVLSWYVMISKVRYLNEMNKGNALFLREWKHVATDLTILDDADSEKSKSMGGRIDKAGWRTMRNSSVYRIYHTGVEEIQHRLAADRALVERKGLSGRSIQAIRASLDGTLVRETQKISKLIVLLTICISGGPFLGLLGTVVGVMITFAAVAAAGDVNVNAIAPGIAAALLATVAGLAVAIPSLFGYNYILSIVKDAKDDMHIFIDEFVTKMAEFYKE